MTRHARETTRFAQAASLLAIIKGDPDRLDAVLELQRMLIRALLRGERRIIRLKKARQRLMRIKARERLPRGKARTLKTLVKELDRRVEAVRHLLFLWR